MSYSERVFISVRNGRAFVSRYTTQDNGSFFWESATNATDLEDEALAVVAAQGGVTTEQGEYVCPPELAARAHWHGSRT